MADPDLKLKKKYFSLVCHLSEIQQNSEKLKLKLIFTKMHLVIFFLIFWQNIYQFSNKI
jgi:hypothetical protein